MFAQTEVVSEFLDGFPSRVFFTVRSHAKQRQHYALVVWNRHLISSETSHQCPKSNLNVSRYNER